jgi:hypothetical protein
MEACIKFVPSAFKHGITEAQIRSVILNWRYDDIDVDAPDKHLLIGFDSLRRVHTPAPLGRN